MAADDELDFDDVLAAAAASKRASTVDEEEQGSRNKGVKGEKNAAESVVEGRKEVGNGGGDDDEASGSTPLKGKLLRFIWGKGSDFLKRACLRGNSEIGLEPENCRFSARPEDRPVCAINTRISGSFPVFLLTSF